MFLRVLLIFSLSLTNSFTRAKNFKHELRLGAGLPFTFIVATPGVVQLSVNAEYSRKLKSFYPFIKTQYSSYQRLTRKEGQPLATKVQLSLNALEFHLGLKYSFIYKNVQIRPLLSIAYALGQLNNRVLGMRSDQNFKLYTVGVEVHHAYSEKFFVSFSGLVSRLDYSQTSSPVTIKYNRPTLELNIGRYF